MPDRNRCQGSQFRRTQHRSLLQQQGTGPDVLPGQADVGPQITVRGDDHRVGSVVGVFLADHAVGTFGKLRPSEDSGCLAMLEPAHGLMTCGNLLDDGQGPGAGGAGPSKVVTAHRISIHRGIGVGWNIDRAGDGLGEDGSCRIVERHPEGGLPTDVGEDPTGRFGGREWAYGSTTRPCSQASMEITGSHIVSWNRTTRHGAVRVRSSVTTACHSPAPGVGLV